MSKISFLTIDEKCNTFNLAPDVEVKVLQYLPIEQKNDIIQLTLQNSEENGVFNYLLLDMYFHLYICYLYTDIDFTEEEKENPANTFDVLTSTGVLNQVIATMNPDEYKALHQILDTSVENKIKYNNTLASVINSFVEQMPINAEKAGEIISNFNPEKFQQVLAFAKAANGDRQI